MADNKLYYGDNLEILRHHIADESVDLVYLDPPFNSNQSYNVLFAEKDGTDSPAQIKAFEDTWKWDQESSYAFQEFVETGPSKTVKTLLAFKEMLGTNDMLAYLTMMAPRMVELHRVLKPTGSLYLHCDPTASHFLKILLDSIFGPRNFKSEIVWKRTSAHSSANRYGPVHDVILFYTKSPTYLWNKVYLDYDDNYLAKYYNNVDKDGRRYTLSDLMAAGIRHGESGKQWRGIDPASKGNHWKFKISKLDELEKVGRIHWPAKGTIPRYKRYLDEMEGILVQDFWNDINPVSAHAKERLGYPTQKPEALLERIIKSSSNEGDLVLDPFCGCGTTITVAEHLKR